MSDSDAEVDLEGTWKMLESGWRKFAEKYGIPEDKSSATWSAITIVSRSLACAEIAVMMLNGDKSLEDVLEEYLTLVRAEGAMSGLEGWMNG